MYVELITKILGWLWNSFKRKNAADQMKIVGKIHDELNTIMSNLGCCRVLLLRTSNGGGRPVPGSPLYSSTIYQVWDSRFRPVGWESQRVDGEYVDLLIKLLKNRKLRLCKGELPDGQLKDIYTANNINGSVLALVGSDKNHIYYLSCNFAEKDVPPLNSTTKEHIRPHRTNITNLMGLKETV